MSDKTFYLGIDPGQSGGLAIVDEAGAVIDTTPMPDTEHDIAEYFREFAPRIRMAFIEAVHSMPNDGGRAAFSFGMSYGALKMALAAFRVPVTGVAPQVWQRRIGVPKGARPDTKTQRKNRTKARAQELFPERKLTHAIADSLLLAEDCRRMCGGKERAA